MLVNASDDVLLFLLIIVLIMTALTIVGGIVWGIVTAKKYKAFNLPVSMLAILLAAGSWVFNIGWGRFVMTLMLLPFIHAGAFFITNVLLAPYIIKDRTLKRINIFFMITYLIPYIFLPDARDVGGTYFFFGLIRNDTLEEFAWTLSGISFAAHIVLFVLQMVQVAGIKKSRSVPEEKNES